MRHFYDKFIMRALAGFSIPKKMGSKKITYFGFTKKLTVILQYFFEKF